MLPNIEPKMDKDLKPRNLTLDLNSANLSTSAPQPILVIQSPKTPTLSKKLKAVSLDAEPPKQAPALEARDVFSMPNTPKRQARPKHSESFESRTMLAPSLNSNLKRFGSNTSISGSQTLKTLPEIMTLQDFSDSRSEPVRIKAKGLLERRGSNASLTIDLGSSLSLAECKPHLNTAKSVSNLHLSAFDSEKCRCERDKRRKSAAHSEACQNCTIYEQEPSKTSACQAHCRSLYRRCNCLCSATCRRRSLSNENLYAPPCNFCANGGSRDCLLGSKNCKGYQRACYPRQPDLEASQLLSEDFKLHLQNIQYLQTAGSVISVTDLKAACLQPQRVAKLHQEFWEVPLNLQEKCLVSGSQSRNRYRGVLPNEHSRVILPGEQSYIHANYIKGPDYSETAYIATQGPMGHTCVDFWELVWFKKTSCIVMLTHLVEKGRSKCELYFPLGKRKCTPDKTYFSVTTTKVYDKFTFDSKTARPLEEEVVTSFEESDEIRFGHFRIRFLKEQSLGECSIRHLEVTRTGEDSDKRLVYHYWFPNWQDHKMANPEEVLQMALHVLDHASPTNNSDNNLVHSKNKKMPSIVSNSSASGAGDKFNGLLKSKDNSLNSFLEKPASNVRRRSYENCRSPLIVHCSAGIGRTGCFLAILNGIQQLRTNYNVDVLAILCSLRLNRGGMVQTAEQYELIHRVLSLYTDVM